MKIKSSGETVEVNEQIMKILRAEEKKLYREFETMSHFNSDDPGKKTKASILCPAFDLNAIDEDVNESESFVLADPHNFEDEIIAEDLERRFASLLTESQKEVFYCVMLGGEKTIRVRKKKRCNGQSN